MATGRYSKNVPALRPGFRKVMMKASSVRQVKRYLKSPFSDRSAVIYFTEKERRPFILTNRGGISADGRYGLLKGWKLTKDKLDRIFIVAAVEDTTKEAEKDEN